MSYLGKKMIKNKKIKSCFLSLLVALLLFGSIPQLSAIQNEEKINTSTIGTLVPDLAYFPMSHDFGNVIQGAVYQTTFDIWNAGTGTLTWSLGIVNPWLMPNPTSGSSTGEHDTVTVQINTSGLAAGSYSGSIGISANDGGGMRYFTVSFVVINNNPPNTPSPLNGPTSGNIGDTLTYITSTTDPDGDNIAYGIDFFNNGNIDHWSSSYYPSGAPYEIHITFNSPGTFPLRVLAKDIYGAMSAFSPITTVTISGTSNDAPETPTKPTGPNTGTIGVDYQFSTSSTDPDGDTIKYGWDWDGDDMVDEWSGFLSSGSTDTRSHLFTTPGTYNIKVIAEDEHGAQSSFSIVKTITISSNQPPNKPTIAGPGTGKIDKSYTYSASTTDDNGDQIYYWFDWGDGTNSGWKGPYYSGQNASESHVWTVKGTYSVKVKTKDINDAESVWSDPIPVKMPKTMSSWNRILEYFPILKQLINGYF